MPASNQGQWKRNDALFNSSKLGQYLHPPSLFKPKRGIVRETDSLRPPCAKNMKNHAQIIEISY
jgi:hypothetical protein